MFVDTVQVTVHAGDGGNGIVSFRHEKFIDRGGPNGGDGGNGGDVIFVASRNQNTLASFRYQKLLQAEAGKNGQQSNKHGKNGKDLFVAVPIGTVVVDEEGQDIIDLKEDGQQAVAAQGGKGGFGNAHFSSSVRQAPRVAEKGEPGEEKTITLELRLIADVGLVGLPNAGKSTLLSVISNAKPEIADYPFTTIRPNLGVVDVDKQTTLLFADIPGLISGASAGKGLGDAFLRHIERTSVLVHLVDAYSKDIVEAYKTIMAELKAYKIDLSTRPQVVVLTKIEGLDKPTINELLSRLQPHVPAETPLLAISAQAHIGLKELLYEIKALVAVRRVEQAQQEAATIPVIGVKENPDSWRVEKTKKGFLVTGRKIERFAIRTDLSDFHGQQRLRDIMKKMGIMAELRRQGIELEQPIQIGQNKDQKILY